MKRVALALLFLLSSLPALAQKVFEDTTAANLPTCASVLIGNAFYVTDATSASDCTGGGSTKIVCVCNGTSWTPLDTTGSVSDGDKGDISVSGGGATWSIDSDAVVEADLKAVDAASDEDILTYESTTGDFEWHTTSQKLDDIGSTRGNVLYRGLSAWSALAVGTSGQVLTTQGSGADPVWADAGATTGAPYNQYDPDKPPSTCATCEEWTNDTATLSWSWGNQGGATETLEMDGATLAIAAGTGVNLRARCVAAPGSGDWVAHTKVSGVGSNASNAYGLLALQGTVGAPTRIDSGAVVHTGVGNADYRSDRYSSFTSWTSNNWNHGDITEPFWWGRPVYIRMAFTDSSNNLEVMFSGNGRVYGDVLSASIDVAIGGNPDYMCIYVSGESATTGTTANFEFFRLRTDSGKRFTSD